MYPITINMPYGEDPERRNVREKHSFVRIEKDYIEVAWRFNAEDKHGEFEWKECKYDARELMKKEHITRIEVFYSNDSKHYLIEVGNGWSDTSLSTPSRSKAMQLQHLLWNWIMDKLMPEQLKEYSLLIKPEVSNEDQ